MTNRGFVGYPPQPAALPGTVLAVTQYQLAANVTTNSATFADIDATNLKVVFTAPASGNVIARLEGSSNSAGATTYGWNLRDGGGDIANTIRDVSFSQANAFRSTVSIYVTGLTPGNSYTWKWGHGLNFGSGTCALNGGSVATRALMTVTSA